MVAEHISTQEFVLFVWFLYYFEALKICLVINEHIVCKSWVELQMLLYISMLILAIYSLAKIRSHLEVAIK